MPDRRKALSEILRELAAAPGALTVGEVVQAFGSRAFGGLLFVFAVPNLLPLPPGASTVLGAPLVLLAPQLALGMRRPWLPRRVEARRLRVAAAAGAFARIVPWLERVERLSRPRLPFLFGPVGERVAGVICTSLALVLVLPIPLGNLLPAAAVSLLALALVQRDGLLALAGYLLAAASWTVLLVAAGVVWQALRSLAALFVGA